MVNSVDFNVGFFLFYHFNIFIIDGDDTVIKKKQK